MSGGNVDVQTVHSVEITLKPGVAGTKDTPGQRPQTRTIAPGTLMRMKDGQELAELREAGAVKEPDGKHKLDLRNGENPEDGNVDLSIAAHRVPRSLLPGTGANPAPALDGGEGDEHQNEANRRAQESKARTEGEDEGEDEGEETGEGAETQRRQTPKAPTPKAPAQTGAQKRAS